MIQLEHGGRRVSVTADRLVIGSSPDAGLSVEGHGVLAEHAKVRRRPDGALEVVPASAAAFLLVNGHRAGSTPHVLVAGDRLGMGDQEVVVLSDTAATGATQRLNNTMMGMPVLTPEMRAELVAKASVPHSPTSPPAVSPARRIGLLVLGVAVAATIVYFLLFRG
ncbi:MAG TPA: FHA domain-containing protein [Gemmatimonadales bacterium]|nr:FHA domain-containing protein [Gemmatimonadales bacterium]